MSIWKRISDALAALAQGEGLSAVFEKLRTPRTQDRFYDCGHRTRRENGQGGWLGHADEVTAFRQVFHIPASETQNAVRVFDLARKDVAGSISMPRVFATCLVQGIRSWSIC